MRKLRLKPILVNVSALMLVCLLVTNCKDICLSGYFLELPEAPESWVSLLGQPHWRIEWIDPGGVKKIADVPPDSGLKIEIPVEWSNPVTAWPYWPDHNLIPGLFKPSGAIFPFDAKDGNIFLSWEAGVDSIFYWELLLANENNYSRIPANFDWPRFRDLFYTDRLNGDPWLVNWRSVAERTVSGNFDTRRLVPESAESRVIPVSSGGPWYGVSPFTEPLVFLEGELSVFPIRSGVNVWISSDGVLRINGNAWVFSEMKN